MKLLLADDEVNIQELLGSRLRRLGHEVTVCPDGRTALAAMEKNSFDGAILDFTMPGLNGIQVLERLKAESPDTEAVILTGNGTMDAAVAAVRLGAFDFLKKPVKPEQIEELLTRMEQKRELTRQFRALRHRLDQIEGSPQLIGQSPGMQQVAKLISRVAPTESTVLIRGETGTGKELVARAIHDQSLRAGKPYVAINCGALPESLIESELFGHNKGSFTGADAHRTGLFEVAHGGTVFLDEIGELPKAVQAKLLRFLESGEIRRVGENENRVVDVRVVCATHRNLESMVRDDEFREDLLFRINPFEIHLPPLRDRGSDLEMLAGHLLRRLKPQLKPDDLMFSPEALALLKNYRWPGNVRELANVVEHASILCDVLPILPEHLPLHKLGANTQNVPQPTVQRHITTHSAGPSGPHFTVEPGRTLREVELELIQHVLDKNSGNKPKTAEELGVSLKTLYNKLNQIKAGETE
jgi:two-component system NtrC family response regulator